MDEDIRRIYEQWHETVRARDLAGTLALYSEHAVLETPLAMIVMPDKHDGVLRGKKEIKPFFEAGIRMFANTPAQWFRTGTFFSNGRQLTWEYPRETPHGEQTDLIEMMDIAEGLIVHHRVYWGWYGVKMLMRAAAASNSGTQGS